MLPTDTKAILPLIIIMMVVMAIVLIIDMVLLIRWLIYRIQLNDALAAMEEREEGRGKREEKEEAQEEGDREEKNSVSPSPAERSEGIGDPNRKSEIENRKSVPPPFAPTWSLAHPFVGIQAALLATAILLALPMMGIILSEGVKAQSSPAMMLLLVFSLFVQNFCFVAVVAYFLRRYGTSLRKIGLEWPTRRQIGLGLGLGVLLLIVAQGAGAGIESLAQHYLSRGTWEALTQMTKAADAGALFQKIHGNWLKLLFVLGGAVAAPIGEEVFFRGFLYNVLKRRLNVTAGIVLSGLCFALIHFNPLGVIVIFPMGMALAYVYERTKSLWVTIIMHAVNNGALFVIMWLWPHFGN
jgi:membrane protease YdiL (CAAX protease family)